MTARRRRRREDLQRRGLAPRPQQCDLEAVQPLAQHDRRTPEHISEEARRQDFLFLLQEKKVAASTFRLHLYGSRWCYERPRQRPWPVFALVRPQKSHKLPVVLSLQEVRPLLALVEHPTAQMGLRMLSAGGLRLPAGTPRLVAALDVPRRLVWGRQAKGRKDRCVPLAPRVLAW
jgi:site-specific recombinase XerD